MKKSGNWVNLTGKPKVMNEINHRTQTEKGDIRQFITHLAERQPLPYSHQTYPEVIKEPKEIDPRLLQRYSFDDNGGGYKGL
jgi:hypothetical protein